MENLHALIQKYKEVYESVYQFDIGNESFIFRPLTRKEYKEITERQYPDEYSIDELICHVAIVHPVDYGFSDTGKAGIAKALSEQILAYSGYLNPGQQTQMLNYYRSEMMRFDMQAEACISIAFPTIQEEEMADWTQEKLFRMLAKAEWALREVWGRPIQFGGPEEEEGEEEKEEPIPPTIEEIAEDIRANGGDPMFVMAEQLKRRPDEGYVQFPVIGGTKLLKNEEVLNHVREHVSRLSSG